METKYTPEQLKAAEKLAIKWAVEAQAEKKLNDESNEKFIPLYKNQSRFLVLVGGGGSGKSIFAGRKLLERLTKEKGHRFLVCRKVARTLRESCFQQLQGQIAEYYNYDDFAINKTDMTITYKPNKNVILFSGLDDVEKMKSIYNITGIWIEEASELEEGDLNQLNIRLRGETKHYKQIIITFNPIDVNHWLKKKFFDSVVEDATTMHSTYKDNKFLDDAAKKVLESFKDTDPYYYDVYCLGHWGVLGQSIFDKEKVNNRLLQIRDKKPLKTGLFEYQYVNERIVDSSIKWVEDETGYIKIYEDVKKDYPYVIGGDTAGDGSDYFIGQVIENTTGKQVATLRHLFDEDLYAQQMYCLGRYYNTALIGIEVNYSTHPVKELKRLQYPKQYMREREDNISEDIMLKYGFRTDSLTRPIVIAGLVSIVRDRPDIFNDVTTLEEMLSFIRNPKKKGRPEAAEGAHDDCVMAMAITYYVREQQSFKIPEEQPIAHKKWIETISPKKKKRGLI